MTYKKLLASTALAGLLATSNAFSQTTNFVGPSLALTGSYVGASSSFKTGGVLNEVLFFDGDGLNSKLGERTNIIPGADLNYGFAMGNNFVLGVGATYDFSKTKTGEFSTNLFLNGEDTTVALDSTLKNHYSLYVQPTYVVNKDTAMFAKIGRHYSKSTVNSNPNTSVSFSSEGGDDLSDTYGLLGTENSVSKNLEGWGYGIGLKAFLSNNLFVQVEAAIVDYDKVNLPFVLGGDLSGVTAPENPQSSIKIKTTNATVSVGYKF